MHIQRIRGMVTNVKSTHKLANLYHPVTRYHATSDSYDAPKFRMALHLNANRVFGDRMAVSLGPFGGLGIPGRHGTEGCGRVQDMLERLWPYIDLREKQLTGYVRKTAKFRTNPT